jgi:predicted TPR repeat methyltransferase
MSSEHETRRTVTIEEAVHAATALHRAGHLEEAEALYRQILDAAPDNADALHFLGLLMRQSDRDAEALDLMRRAVASAPGYASAHNNLGNLLCEAGRFAEARRHLVRALELSPHDPRALNNLGNVAHASGHAEEAIRCYEQAIALSPDFPLPYENLGRMRLRTGDVAQAYALFCKAVALDHTRTRSRQFVGIALCELGRYDEAREHYRTWSEAEPDNAEPRHLLASVEGDAAPPRASDAYVRTLFDGFARTFEVHLQKLQYRAPALVSEALADAGAGGGLAILDAGCGTGLCGPLLRQRAAKLTGVDLSPKMLEHARASGHYDELCEAELSAFMRLRAGCFDAIACADTLCYFGELDEAAQAAFEALRPGGLFAFTLEALPADSQRPYRLTYTGRYAHGAEYVCDVLGRSGFEPARLAHEWLRMEAGKEVAGHVVLVRKPVI